METNLTIKSWAQDDRPREKMLTKGKNALSDAELIAVILGSGTISKSAITLAREILFQCNHNLQQLGTYSPKELMQFKGVGKAKAIALSAALELSKRRLLQKSNPATPITSPQLARDMLSTYFQDLQHEEFYVMYLSRSNRVIDIRRISIGGRTGTVADGKIIFKEALTLNACGIILAHNHPSGQLTPSESDKQLTEQLVACGKYIDLQVLDHLIIHDDRFYSFADEGILR